MQHEKNKKKTERTISRLKRLEPVRNQRFMNAFYGQTRSALRLHYANTHIAKRSPYARTRMMRLTTAKCCNNVHYMLVSHSRVCCDERKAYKRGGRFQWNFFYYFFLKILVRWTPGRKLTFKNASRKDATPIYVRLGFTDDTYVI